MCKCYLHIIKKTDLISVGTCLTFVFILKIFYLLFYTICIAL